MGKRSVFTNWDPALYERLDGDDVIVHLFSAGLRSDQVIIKGQDLSFNESLAALFVPSALDENGYIRRRALFEELIDTGIFKVAIADSKDFRDPVLADLAEIRPIAAIGQHISNNKLFKPSERQQSFEPEEEPFRSFYPWLDSVLLRDRDSSLYRSNILGDMPSRFHAEFIATIERCRANLKEHWHFGSLSAPRLDRLGELLSDPERAAGHIHVRGRDSSPIVRSARALVYEIAATDEFKPEEGGLKRLAQSVYAAVYCDAEDAVGVYNSLLAEVPTPDPLEAEPTPSLVVEDQPAFSFEIRSGLGQLLIDLRQTVSDSGSYSLDLFHPSKTEEPLARYKEASKKYGDAVASEASNFAVFCTFADKAINKVAALSGFVDLIPLPAGAQPIRHIIDGIAKHAMEGKPITSLASKLEKVVRSARPRELLHRELLRVALQQRFNRVPLLSKTQLTASSAR